ncbi:unnamed protein product [Amoebophrya sp. A120]|nr:unnamed protein product [Amoebophrya sp. A120]|eukprot:GSA120T00000287001.1
MSANSSSLPQDPAASAAQIPSSTSPQSQPPGRSKSREAANPAGDVVDPNYVAVELGKQRLDELGLAFTKQEWRELLEEDVTVKNMLEGVDRILHSVHSSSGGEAVDITAGGGLASRIREHVADLWKYDHLQLLQSVMQKKQDLCQTTIFDPETGEMRTQLDDENAAGDGAAQAGAAAGSGGSGKPRTATVPAHRVRQIERLLQTEPRLRAAINRASESDLLLQQETASGGQQPSGTSGGATKVDPAVAAAQLRKQSKKARSRKGETDANLATRIKSNLSGKYRQIREKNWDLPTLGGLEVDKRAELLLADRNTEFFFHQRRYLIGIVE